MGDGDALACMRAGREWCKLEIAGGQIARRGLPIVAGVLAIATRQPLAASNQQPAKG